jgi:hypothetical protein
MPDCKNYGPTCYCPEHMRERQRKQQEEWDASLLNPANPLSILNPNNMLNPANPVGLLNPASPLYVGG